MVKRCMALTRLAMMTGKYWKEVEAGFMPLRGQEYVQGGL